MPYRYLKEIATADVAFEADGGTLEELFVSAAEATMNTMVEDLDSINRARSVNISVENAEIDLLLFNFLQELIFYKDAERLLLRIDSLKVTSSSNGHALTCNASGEEIDHEHHRMLVDVKAVTLHRFSVRETEEGWKATVVLDI